MADTPSTPGFSKHWFISMIVLVAIGGGFYIIGKNIEVRKANDVGELSAVGDAQVFVTPTTALLSVGVQTDIQSTAADAMNGLKNSMNQVLAAVKQGGVTDKDITTNNLSLTPTYDYTNGTQKLQGYQASQSLTVRTKNLDKVGDIINAATDAGANQIGDVQFVADDPSTMKDTARKEAIADAQKRAQTMAAQLGVALGALKSYSEDVGGSTPPPVPYMMKADAAGAVAPSSVPVPAGQQEIDVEVTLTYNIQ